MSKRSFKSKQKTEATDFDWKIWSLPPTYTPAIEHPRLPHYWFNLVYVDHWFCDNCDCLQSTSDFRAIDYRYGRLCFSCYHLEELDFGYEDPICLLPQKPPISSIKEEPGSESAST